MRVGRVLASATVACLAGMVLGHAVADARTPSVAKVSDLAREAYIWGLPAEFVYRFEKYNNLVTAPRNTLGGSSGVAAAWNNNATNGGDASVLYLNSMLDLSGKKGRGGTKELVLTVPPSQSGYYVVNVLDGFINSVGSIGTRTTPSAKPQTYLVVGPTSRYANRRTVKIRGFRYRVMASDTNLNWVLIRVRADALVPFDAPTSVTSVQHSVVEKFALNTLREFEANDHEPSYFEPGQYHPTPAELQQAKRWHSAPTKAVAFFKQVGRALRLNPLPTRTTGLNGIPLEMLPPWVVAQAGAQPWPPTGADQGKRPKVFRNPAYGQRAWLARFKPIGLTANGFKVPRGFRSRHVAALKAGMVAGNKQLNRLLTTGIVSRQTNYWGYVNAGVGTYANTPGGYKLRSAIVLAGGSANMPQDAVYAQINNLDGTDATQLVGDDTYTLTFRPPPGQGVLDLPAVGGLPPTDDTCNGEPCGFWSIHAYQTDAQESAAPFLTQPSVLNTAYSKANLAVTRVDASTNTLTVQVSQPLQWTPMLASTPIMFGPTAARYGLQPDVPYYVRPDVTDNGDGTWSFSLATLWRQELSPDDVPVQGAFTGQGGSGPVDQVKLDDPGGQVNLTWGPIQPVTQLGSQQMTSGSLARNDDGSVTIWLAPALPPNAPATNWLPTPSKAYYQSVYGKPGMPTNIRPMIRIYYPRVRPPSILPPAGGRLGATYVFPRLEPVSQASSDAAGG